MFPPRHQRFRQRLVALCWLGLYGAASLLGSGGLHALAPCSCTAPGSTEASCETHGHHHAGHEHSHPPAASQDGETNHDEAPVPCHDDGCVICKSLASPSLRTIPVENVLVTAVTAMRPPRLATRTHSGAPRDILNRGPPAA